MIKYKKILFIYLLIIYGLTLAQPIFAASWLQSIIPGSESIVPDRQTKCPNNAPPPQGEPYCSCRRTGDCQLTDFIVLAVNLFRLMLGVLGSLALLFFIYGGIIFLLSRGNPTMVQRGKSILTQSLVGIMIVLGSWFIVALVIAALTGQELGASIKLFGQEWWRLKQ